MLIYVLDRFGTVLGVLTHRSTAAKAFWNDSHVESLTGELSYDFECPGDQDVAEHVVDENMVLWKDLDGSKRMARIKVCREQIDEDGRYVKAVHAEGTHLDLNGYPITGDVSFTGESAQSIMAVLLASTEWSVGTIEYAGLMDMNFNQGDTVLSAVRSVIANAGLEWRFRVEFDGNRVTGRYVDGVARIGRFTGERFSLGRNVKGFSRVTDSSDMAVAVFPLGASDEDGQRITIASAAWSVENGNPVDKPENDLFVVDPVALNLYGHGRLTTRTFEDSGETSPTKLLQKAWTWLQTTNRPLVSYEMHAAMLDALPNNAGRRLNLGDSVVVNIQKFRPPLEAEVRVSEIRRSYSDATGTGFAVRRGVL